MKSRQSANSIEIPTRDSKNTPEVVQGWVPPWLRRSLVVIAALYLALLTIGNTSCSLTDDLPGVPRYFLQVACLFPDAAETRIDYRVEGWTCRQRRFVELDHQRYFPILADDKESRFQRIGQFYRRSSKVMRALEDYLVAKHNEGDLSLDTDGVLGLMGGIRFLSLRIPFPEVGQPTEEYQYLPIDDYPKDFRKDWYETPIERRKERCGRK